MGHVDLSKKERLNLANQFKILEALYPEQAEDYARQRRAFELGFALHYSDAFEGMDEETSAEECREVLDILDMFVVMQRAFESLGRPGTVDPEDLKFRGFDGNNETKQYLYVRYLFDLGRYESLHGQGHFDDLNSHAPMLPQYCGMLETWRSISVEKRYRLDERALLRLVKG